MSGRPQPDLESPPRGSLHRWWKEPAAHFLVIAVALLVLDYAAEAAEPEARPDTVVGGASDEAAVRARLRADFEASQGRAMTAAEERDAMEDHRYEQQLFDAAVRMGMYQTDPIVRRRLVQRMRFLVENLIQVPPPDDEALATLLEARPDQFPRQRNLTFEHHFFARSAHGAEVTGVAAEARRRLSTGEDVSGDPFPRRLPTDGVSVAELARALGPGVAEAFFGAELDRWSAPIPSAYGCHLVRVRARSSRPPDLEEVRPRVEALWERRARQERGRALMASIASER